MAALILAKDAIVRHDLTRAEELAHEGARLAHDARRPALLLGVSSVLTFIAVGRGRYEAALVHVDEWLEHARGADNLILQLHAHIEKAMVLEGLSRPLDAALEIYCALGLSHSLVEGRWFGPLSARLASLALQVGDIAVAASLTASALIWLASDGTLRATTLKDFGIDLRELATAEGRGVVEVMARLVEVLEAPPVDVQELQGRLREEIRALADECERIDAELSRQGVDPLEPGTWRPRTAAATGHRG